MKEMRNAGELARVRTVHKQWAGMQPCGVWSRPSAVISLVHLIDYYVCLVTTCLVTAVSTLKKGQKVLREF